MANKSMRCETKATKIVAIWLRKAAVGQSKTSQAAGDNSSAAFAVQPVSVAAVGSRSDAPCDIGDYELELVYSGE